MNGDDLARLARSVEQTLELAAAEGKPAGFCIGNTTKASGRALHFTPLRSTAVLALSGVIVSDEATAVEVAQRVDGRVDYILVDAEKKIPGARSIGGQAANIERSVREHVEHSELWVYKGNDLSVDAVDGLLAQLTKDCLRGLGAMPVSIIGAGNLGAKLALRLVERGAEVTVTRRDAQALSTIVAACNLIKPPQTTASVHGTTDNEAAARGAKVVIGCTAGTPAITATMVLAMDPEGLIVDVGKGSLYPEAIQMAEQRGLPVYRLDVTAAFDGLVAGLWAVEQQVTTRMGRRTWNGEPLVSGGLMGRAGEFVVDNVHRPGRVFGVADGLGDFVQDLSEDQRQRLARLERLMARDAGARRQSA